MGDPVILRKLSFGSLNASPRGFDVNLLANSLASRLKQQKSQSALAGRRERHNTGIPPKHSGSSKSRKETKSILLRHDKSSLSPDIRDKIEPLGFRAEGESARSSGKRASASSRRRVDSASSDHQPQLSGRSTSRRSSSAGQVEARSARSGSCRTGSGLAGKHYGSEVSGLSLESRSAGYNVKVVKRDGFFQPMDKYAPGRQLLREVEPSDRGIACEYQTYVLPFLSEDGDGGDSNGFQPSPIGQDESFKKRLKVSWSNIPNNGRMTEEDAIESRQDINFTQPAMQSSMRRAASTDNFVFRRPLYSSGKSRVASVGVNWKIPTVAQEEAKEEKKAVGSKEKAPPPPQSFKKPMWSWLVTQDSQQNSFHKSRGGHSSDSTVRQPTQPASSSSGHDSNSQTHSRFRHSRDIHPVSTAMDREGTSVSKTRWHVPSSNASTLDAERAAMGRLALVKRPGSRLLYEYNGPGTSNSLAQKFRESLLVQGRTEMEIDNEILGAGASKGSEAVGDIHFSGR